MKKTIFILTTLLTSLTSLSALAVNRVHLQMWASINDIHIKQASLESNLNTMKSEISQLKQQIKPFPAHQIGEHYQGGVVFWVDETGLHGLVASINDLNNGQGMQWRNGDSGNRNTNAKADGIGAGESNTQLIIAQQTIDHQSGQFAALLASNYKVLADGITPCSSEDASSVCYGHWYLPSVHELQLLRTNLGKYGLANFAPDYYWSSTEASVSTAWLIDFSSGEKMKSAKSNTLGQVRAVSQF